MGRLMKSFERAFLVGCDSKHEWMIDWWFGNYKKHNNLPVIFADFGLTPEGLKVVRKYTTNILDMKSQAEKGWFLKPKSMLMCPSKLTVWVDLDCEILGSLRGIFKELEVDKLAMVKDHPWTTRRGELWHNSGVVGFVNKPPILKDWVRQVGVRKAVGDQEVLHSMLNPITKITYIKDLPHRYNVLRIDVLDENVPKDPLIIHWTGQKGKEEIRRQMNA